MRRLLGVIVISLAMSGACFAQTADEKSVANAVEFMRQAMISANKADLEKVGLPSLSYGHSSGALENKAQFVDAIASGRNGFPSIDLKNQMIHVEGDTAIVRHILDAKTNNAGTLGEVKIGVVLVFKKVADEWKLLARQAYKLPT